VFWQRQIWDHPDRTGRQTLKQEPLAKPPTNKSDTSTKLQKKRKEQGVSDLAGGKEQPC
jgi:hypothetical protein